MAAREAETMRAVREYLTLTKVFHVRINQSGVPLHDGSGRYRPGPSRGVSDYLGIYRTRPLAVECKSDKGKLTDEQEAFGERWVREGGIFIVARSAEDVRKALAGVITEPTSWRGHGRV